MKKNSLLKSLAFLFVPLFMAACGKDKDKEDITINSDPNLPHDLLHPYAEKILGKWNIKYMIDEESRDNGMTTVRDTMRRHEEGGYLDDKTYTFNKDLTAFVKSKIHNKPEIFSLKGNYSLKKDTIYLKLAGPSPITNNDTIMYFNWHLKIDPKLETLTMIVNKSLINNQRDQWVKTYEVCVKY